MQAEWIGYFITDPGTTPPDGGQLFSETPVFMPHTRFCYGPPDYAPEVAASPVAKSGIITFGSFNRLPKMTDEVVTAWCHILLAVPQSRLFIKSGALSDTKARERLLARFERQGIAPERLDLREGSAHAEMLGEYGDIDIALEPSVQIGHIAHQGRVQRVDARTAQCPSA